MDEFVAPALPERRPEQPLPCPFSAHGMQQPRSVQPPPMFGPRGPTIPPRHLAEYRPSAAARFGRTPNVVPRSVHTFHARPSADDAPHPLLLVDTPPSQAIACCEPCDRVFPSADALREHRASEHRRCSVDGCRFEGHAKRLQAHVQEQHRSGLYERIRQLNTPADIERWRAERRKRFPSAANVELRQRMQEARQQRGERLPAETGGRFASAEERRRLGKGCANGGKTGSKAQEKSEGAGGKRKRKRGGGAKKQKPVEAIVVEAGENDADEDAPMRRFAGTMPMKGYKRPKKTAERVANALSGLIGDYGSDDDDEDESSDAEENVEPVKVNEAVEIPSVDDNGIDERIPDDVQPEDADQNDDAMDEEDCRPADDSDDGPPEEQLVRRVDEFAARIDEPTESKESTVEQPKPASVRRSRPMAVLDLTRRYRNQNTMLEKLLQADIRHERNVLLQCVRHVVAKRFFGIGQKTDPTAENG